MAKIILQRYQQNIFQTVGSLDFNKFFVSPGADLYDVANEGLDVICIKLKGARGKELSFNLGTGAVEELNPETMVELCDARFDISPITSEVVWKDWNILDAIEFNYGESVKRYLVVKVADENGKVVVFDPYSGELRGIYVNINSNESTGCCQEVRVILL